MNYGKQIGILIFILSCTGLAAQSLQGLQENQVIKKYLAEHPYRLKSASFQAPLTLPFFEDFSASEVVPDPAKWANQYVFINQSFAVEPPSVGVATFDAIDANGNVYSTANRPFSSDSLTSLEFDLSPYESSGDTVRLSFFYQCGGKGEVPEINDSLLLEFYAPATEQWDIAWFAIMDTASDFLQQIIKIPEVYYQNGFRFRFRNYTSISSNDVNGGEGAVSNADCWNLDYIRMNTESDSAHRSINDIALAGIPRKMLDNYEIIPWMHLNAAQNITRNFMNFDIRMLQQNGQNVGRSYYMKDLNSGYTETYEKIFEEFGPDTLIRRNDPFFAPFTRSDDSREGRFNVVSYLDTPADQFKMNDTSGIILHFKDFYAFDDGSPEYGFGIAGPSTAGALLALRFRIYQTDTLRAVDMLFNKARGDFNADLEFQLCVWKDNNGEPGDLLYVSPETFTPGIITGMPDFKRYRIPAEEDLLITDTVVYVGWKQVTDEFLNLGYDVNRDNLSRTFVNVGGVWFNPGGSIIPGSIMMRAVFGSKRIILSNEEVYPETSAFVIYPNPASDFLNIQTNGITLEQLILVDITGRIIKQVSGNTSQIDVSGMSSGLYQMMLITTENQVLHRKVIIRH